MCSLKQQNELFRISLLKAGQRHQSSLTSPMKHRYTQLPGRLQGIRCNALCPGTVHTPFVEGYLMRNFPGREDEVRQQLHNRQPLGRMGLPEEIANAALYLASDEAAFVTGSSLVIDGGWTAK